MFHIQTYKIIYKNKEIAIYREINGKLEIMRNRGKEIQPYKKDFFWSWWKKESKYIKGEGVYFTIETDDNNFEIDESITVLSFPLTRQEKAITVFKEINKRIFNNLSNKFKKEPIKPVNSLVNIFQQFQEKRHEKYEKQALKKKSLTIKSEKRL